MSNTPRIGAPELVLSQAAPETTVNEQVRYTEQGAGAFIVKDKDLATPPGAPADGDAYIVAAAATGAWSGQSTKIAFYLSSAWAFIAPIEGTKAYVQDENADYQFDGAAWAATSSGSPILQGVHTIPIMAAAMTARTTSGATAGTAETTTNKVMTRTLDFDAANIEYSQIMIPMPKSWNEGTVTVQFIWTAGATGDVVWACQGVALSDDDALDTAFGTAQSVTDSVTAAGDLMQSAFTSAITIAGTPAAEDTIVLQFYRDASNGSDTLAADAKLIGVRIKYTIAAGDDS